MVVTPAFVLRTAAVVVCVACAYLLWPVAAPVAMMKAPGGAGLFISRAAFEANPQLYFQLLRTLGAKAAAAAFQPVWLAGGLGWCLKLLWWLRLLVFGL
ncbi:hypothetical protein HU200_051874 [Digitaria exilis]|uniref:Uncharacterized protein n=1 Tax=Digitaria exilis TaxID=1010633 RepID=A0A835E9R4_9POAL|nr:hypothetical protein HU200_051874 [Digitaria exilis]